jgi:hypothetical protein
MEGSMQKVNKYVRILTSFITKFDCLLVFWVFGAQPFVQANVNAAKPC